MPNVYVEPHPKGRPEGSAINDYVVEDHADHVLKTFKTQHEAIDWAKENGHTPLVARSVYFREPASLASSLPRSTRADRRVACTSDGICARPSFRSATPGASRQAVPS